MEEIYDEFDVISITKENDTIIFTNTTKKVISEISLKIFVNGEELVSLLCLNQCHKELALGFLYNEGIINAIDDIIDINYNERLFAVMVQLKEHITIDRQQSLRSITSGCGKCYTYINPLKKSKFKSVAINLKFSVSEILNVMEDFVHQSEVFKVIGGVHSVLFYNQEYKILNEDIGRHNCFDKISGILLNNKKMELASESVIFVSGRISSEIITKVIRLGVPVLVSRSTPTTAAVKLAQEYNITLLGYIRGNKGYVYSASDRLNS